VLAVRIRTAPNPKVSGKTFVQSTALPASGLIASIESFFFKEPPMELVFSRSRIAASAAAAAVSKKTVVMKGASHGVMVSHPDAVARLIEDAAAEI
jgi:hypothetical protein